MATLIACADGNLTAAATWAVVDATSFLDEYAYSTFLTTSYVTSSTFTPGAIEIDGIAVKFHTKAAGMSGTMSVALDQGGSTVAGTEVTIDPGDISNCTAFHGGWLLFKFSPVTLAGSTAYSVKVKTSNGGGAPYLFTSANANGNWARMLRTTDVTHTPAATDTMHIIGEHTGGGTGTSFTVIMNSEATTDYAAISVAKRGTLTWGTTASKNYVLVVSGNVIVYSGGTWNQGTTGTPMPSTSTGFLKLDCTTDGEFGFLAKDGSTVNIQGASKTYDRALVATDVGGYCSTSGTTVTRLQGLTFTGWPTGAGTIIINGTAYQVNSVTDADHIVLNSSPGTLTAVSYVHAAASEVTLVTDVSTDWASGDSIGIASTSRTYTDCQKTTLNGAASGTTLTLTDAMTRAHIGTSPTQAEVINLTRNVGICSNSATLMAYVVFETTATVDIDWAEFYYLGENATDKHGVNIKTTTGSCNLNRCSFHDCEDGGIDTWGSAHSNWTISYGVLYNCGSEALSSIRVIVTSGTWTISNTIVMYQSSSSTYGFEILDVGGTLTNNTAIGIKAWGMSINEQAIMGTFSDLLVHSCGNSGIPWQGTRGINSVTNVTVWRCAAQGVVNWGIIKGLTINNLVLFGNLTSNLDVSSVIIDCVLNAPVLSSDVVFPTVNGINNSAINSSLQGLVINNGDFSTVSGIKIAHTNDINISATLSHVKLLLNNTKLGASVEVYQQSNMLSDSYIRSMKHDQTVGEYRSWEPYGSLKQDTALYDVSPSVRGTPNNATNKFEMPVAMVNVDSGATATVSVKVRESDTSTGDSASYIGSRARLIVKANIAAGIAADAVLATATAASDGAWETLTGTTAAVTDNCTLEFMVDCDNASSNTGWINVDTATVA